MFFLVVLRLALWMTLEDPSPTYGLPYPRPQWQTPGVSENPYPPPGLVLGIFLALVALVVSPIMAIARRNAIELALGTAWALMSMWEALEHKLYRLITWN